MSITVDYREQLLIESMKEADMEFKVENLKLGDVIIKSETCELIIERKTQSDLAGSILDGRFREQKDRLSMYRESSENVKLLYIIEQKMFPIKIKKAMMSALVNLNFKHDIPTIYSKNVQETVEFVQLLQDKTTKNELVATRILFNEKPKAEKKVKFEQFSPFVKLLLTVPQLTFQVAEAITALGITSVPLLQQTLKNEPIKIEQLKINNRRINKNIIVNLQELFL